MVTNEKCVVSHDDCTSLLIIHTIKVVTHASNHRIGLLSWLDASSYLVQENNQLARLVNRNRRGKNAVRSVVITVRKSSKRGEGPERQAYIVMFRPRSHWVIPRT